MFLNMYLRYFPCYHNDSCLCTTNVVFFQETIIIPAIFTFLWLNQSTSFVSNNLFHPLHD